jgi:hypothetical protein
MPKQINLPNRISIRISDKSLKSLEDIKQRYLRKNKLEKVSTGLIIEHALTTLQSLKL